MTKYPNSECDAHKNVKTREPVCIICMEAELADLRARLEKAEKYAEWQPIETAPEGVLVVVGWLYPEDAENPERYEFDYKEDGCWMRHEDLYQEYCAIAPPESTGPSPTAPYTHWMAIPPIPKIAAIAKERT